MPLPGAVRPARPGAERQRVRRLAACCVLALAASAGVPARADGEPAARASSEFRQLALGLRRTPRPVRSDFAVAVLREMIAMYRAEIKPGDLAVDDSAYARWSRSVSGFADQLQAAADRIAPGTPVAILSGPDGDVYLEVQGRPIIVSAPRMARQAALERSIVAHFCDQYPCDGLIEGYSERSGERIDALPHWQFRVGPVPSCSTGTGLELLFNSERRLLEKRELCRQLFAELAALARALAAAQRRGVALEWDQLRLQAVDAATTQVLVNRAGDGLALSLPTLAASPRLLGSVLPWLISATEGAGHRGILLVVTNTEDLVPGW